MSIFDEASPEEAQQLMKLYGLAQQDEMLKEQLAQSEALRGKGPRRAYGLWGGITNGMADAADKIFAGIESNQARTRLDKNMTEEEAGRKLATDILGRRPKTGDDFPDVEGSESMLPAFGPQLPPGGLPPEVKLAGRQVAGPTDDLKPYPTGPQAPPTPPAPGGPQAQLGMLPSPLTPEGRAAMGMPPMGQPDMAKQAALAAALKGPSAQVGIGPISVGPSAGRMRREQAATQGQARTDEASLKAALDAMRASGLYETDPTYLDRKAQLEAAQKSAHVRGMSPLDRMGDELNMMAMLGEKAKGKNQVPVTYLPTDEQRPMYQRPIHGVAPSDFANFATAPEYATQWALRHPASRGVDVSIGEPKLLGRNSGKSFRAFKEEEARDMDKGRRNNPPTVKR